MEEISRNIQSVSEILMTGIEEYQSKTKLSLIRHKDNKKRRVIADPARLKYFYYYCDVVFIANYCLKRLRPNTPTKRIPVPNRSMVAGSGTDRAP